MAVAITSEPIDDLNVSNQHLLYTIYDSASTPDRYVVEVYENSSFLNDGTLIATVYITPNAQNRGVFDLSDIVENRLIQTTTVTYQGQFKFVHNTGTAEQASTTDRCVRKYTIKAKRLDNGVVSGLDTAIKYLVNGAWQIKDGKHPSFSEFYCDATSNTAKAWLTNLPNNSQLIERHMADEDEGRAQIVQHSLMGVTCFLNRVRYELRNSAGALLASKNLTVGLSVTLPQNIRNVPMGPVNLEAYFGSDWDDTWSYCDLIPEQTGVQLGATLRIHRDCRPIKHQPVQLAWANSVGGWDMVRFDARAPKTIQKNEKRFRKDPLDWQGTTTSWQPWDRGTTTFHNEGRKRFTLTHDQFTTDERALLEFCMRSRLVYYRYGTAAWAPCVVETDSLLIEPAGSKMYRVSLVIEDANPVRC